MSLTERLCRNLGNVIAALIVAGLGLAFAWIGSGYGVGTTSRIGPGFFPLLTGLLLAGLGTGLFIEALVSGGKERDAFALRAFVAIMVAVLFFALLIEPYGIIPATFALVTCALLAERRPGILFLLALTAALSLLGIGLFAELLGLPLKPINW